MTGPGRKPPGNWKAARSQLPVCRIISIYASDGERVLSLSIGRRQSTGGLPGRIPLASSLITKKGPEKIPALSSAAPWETVQQSESERQNGWQVVGNLFKNIDQFVSRIGVVVFATSNPGYFLHR